MKIVSWNINGIRAAHQKGALNWLWDQSPELICLQEVKAKKEQIPEEILVLPGYDVYLNSAERPGYSGVATYSKIKPKSVVMGLGIHQFDVEGRVIATEFNDYTLFNVYFPNGQRGLERVQYKLEFYHHLLQICDALHQEGKSIIITGDFNTAHQEIDLANPEENIATSGFLPEERVWVTKYLDHGFIDIYRHLYPERQQFTWWTYRFGARRRNIGWRIDYFLLSEKLKNRVQEVTILEDIQGSDHCPVVLDLE